MHNGFCQKYTVEVNNIHSHINVFPMYFDIVGLTQLLIILLSNLIGESYLWVLVSKDFIITVLRHCESKAYMLIIFFKDHKCFSSSLKDRNIKTVYTERFLNIKPESTVVISLFLVQTNMLCGTD